MARKPSGKKVRVDFRQNRQVRGRSDVWTRKFHEDQDALADERRTESVRAKGELSRKRTIRVGEDDAPPPDAAHWRSGRVLTVHGRIAHVDAEGQNWECTVRRVLRTLLIEQRSPVAVGDVVWFSDQSAFHDGQPVGVIERVAPRSSRLSRRERRGREHTLVANADQLLIVASVAEPRLKPHLIDRYIVAGHQGGLRPIICFTKTDLLPEPDAQPTAAAATGAADRAASAGAADGEDSGELADSDDVYELDDTHPLAVYDELDQLGYLCLWTSIKTGAGLAELRSALHGHVTVLSGQSGVGKSSLLNALEPGLDLAVRTVSADTQKGRHTTTHARLWPLSAGGYVVDTPGIRAFDLWAVTAGELEALFIEFPPYVEQCRFADCLHRDEEGCAVRAAAESGEITLRRYLSYRKMVTDALAGRP